jgi:uncharacterized damage-inducible protein DinB
MELFTSLLDEALESWHGVRTGLIREVENLPAGEFDFKLAPEARSIAELLQHVLEVAFMMTGELSRPDTDFHREPWPELLDRYSAPVRKAKTKRQLVDLLRISQEEGQRRFERLGEVFMLQLITRFDGRRGTRLAWLHHGIGHEMYHTGQLTAYARALGKVPALTRVIQS